jgi:hypothetical protein
MASSNMISMVMLITLMVVPLEFGNPKKGKCASFLSKRSIKDLHLFIYMPLLEVIANSFGFQWNHLAVRMIHLHFYA